MERMRANTVPGRSGGCALADAHCLVTILSLQRRYLGKVPRYLPHIWLITEGCTLACQVLAAYVNRFEPTVVA